MKNKFVISLRMFIGVALLATIAGIVYAATQTFSSSPGVAIPDAAGGGLCSPDVSGSVSDNINVTLDGTITTVTVDLDISHTFVGDLIVDLTSPASTTVRLVDKIGGTGCDCGADNLIATLSDSGGTSIEDTCGSQAGGGTFAPQNPLSAFNGESAAGTWTLTVMDDNLFDTGTFNSWSITITTTGGSVVVDSPPPSQFEDKRINRLDAAAPIVVYPVTINGELGMNIYDVTSDSNGVFLFQVTAADIAAIGDSPATNTPIIVSNGIQVWRLATGEFQILAPQYNGKTYVLTFSVISSDAPYDSYEY